MRTTLSLDDDAIESVKTYAQNHHLSLGQAASELIRRGSRYQLGTRKVNGLPVFDAPGDFPRVTTRGVRELLDHE
ncbi:MAG TPA: hypothetical protein VK335_28705 [Bryobacteraceae bacterium]|nr:hypothetical protein [Bryobacteraceae bacterium]